MVRWLRINRGVLPSTTTGGREGGERRAKKVAFIYVNRVVTPSSASPPTPHFAPKLRGEPYFAPKVLPLSLRGEKPRFLGAKNLVPLNVSLVACFDVSTFRNAII